MKRTLLVLVLLSSFGFTLAGSAPAPGRACHESNGFAVPRQLFGFEYDAIGEFRAGHTQSANAIWRRAYSYARDHCWESTLVDGDRLLARGQFVKAFDAYAFRLQPYDLLPGYNDADAVGPFMLGLMEVQAGDFPAAEASFRKAIKLVADDPTLGGGFPEADFMLGVALRAQGHRAQALEQWRQALLHEGPPLPEEENFGPPDAWFSALKFYLASDS